ncbi:MAG: peptidylprolyl isomerase [Deltaproteobacteria bacterium]
MRRGLLPLMALLLSACPQAEKKAGDTDKPYPAPEVVAEGEVVAQIGPVTLTTAELEKRLSKQSPFRRMQLKDPSQLEKYVEGEVRMELLAQEGWSQKLYDDPQIKAELKRLLVQRVMNDHIAQLGDALEATDGDLAIMYKQKEKELNKPERIRLSQIVRYVESNGERAAAKKLLARVKSEVLSAQRKNDQTAFGRLARQHSQDDATKNGGGDLQFLDREQLTERYGEEVAKTLFEDATIGDLVVADAPNAVVLFKKTGLRRAVHRSLEQVKSQLRGQIIAEKREAAFDKFIDELMKKRSVVVNEDAFSKIQLEPKEKAAP